MREYVFVDGSVVCQIGDTELYKIEMILVRPNKEIGYLVCCEDGSARYFPEDELERG